MEWADRFVPTIRNDVPKGDMHASFPLDDEGGFWKWKLPISKPYKPVEDVHDNSVARLMLNLMEEAGVWPKTMERQEGKQLIVYLSKVDCATLQAFIAAAIAGTQSSVGPGGVSV